MAAVALATLFQPVAPAAAAAPKAKASIAGGYYPHPSQWPWTTSLIRAKVAGTRGDFGRQLCTAVLISPTRVLTAAHCVDAAGSEGRTAIHPSEVQALVGRRNLTLTEEGQRANVTGIALHPKAYLPDSGAHTNHAFYDIAVLFLDRAVTLTPAVIGTPTDWNTWATVMGFGHWNYDHANRLSDEYLRAADYDTWTDAQCEAAVNYGHSGDHYYPSIHVCANNAPNAQADCVTHGDSGGPMMIQTTAGWRLIGITSFFPQIYTDRCGAGGPFGFAWVAGAEMRDWPLTVPHPPIAGGGNTGGGNTGGGNTGGGNTRRPVKLGMSRGEVRRYIRSMIRGETKGAIKRLKARCARTSYRGYRCRLGWRISRRSYSGRALFWHYARNNKAYWTYTFSGKRRTIDCRRCRVKRLSW